MFNHLQIINAINEACTTAYDIHPSDLRLRLIRFDKNKGILRCLHDQRDHTIFLLQSITHIENKPIQLQTIATSGTIKALVNKHMKELK